MNYPFPAPIPRGSNSKTPSTAMPTRVTFDVNADTLRRKVNASVVSPVGAMANFRAFRNLVPGMSSDYTSHTSVHGFFNNYTKVLSDAGQIIKTGKVILGFLSQFNTPGENGGSSWEQSYDNTLVPNKSPSALWIAPLTMGFILTTGTTTLDINHKARINLSSSDCGATANVSSINRPYGSSGYILIDLSTPGTEFSEHHCDDGPNDGLAIEEVHPPVGGIDFYPARDPDFFPFPFVQNVLGYFFPSTTSPYYPASDVAESAVTESLLRDYITSSGYQHMNSASYVSTSNRIAYSQLVTDTTVSFSVPSADSGKWMVVPTFFDCNKTSDVYSIMHTSPGASRDSIFTDTDSSTSQSNSFFDFDVDVDITYSPEVDADLVMRSTRAGHLMPKHRMVTALCPPCRDSPVGPAIRASMLDPVEPSGPRVNDEVVLTQTAGGQPKKTSSVGFFPRRS